MISHKCQFLPWNVKDSLSPSEPCSKFFFSAWSSCPARRSLLKIFVNRSLLFYPKPLKSLTNFQARHLTV